jgi:GH15 family glucan-1,4-alpha-glucosidase
VVGNWVNQQFQLDALGEALLLFATAARHDRLDGQAWQAAEMAPLDPRSLATLSAVESELAEDGYLYRYRPDERPLGEAEGAFLLCGFVMALATLQVDRPTDAVAWFERNRAASGPAGLLAEEFDVAQRQLRGNIPQAFVHALLLECAQTLGTSLSVPSHPDTDINRWTRPESDA